MLVLMLGDVVGKPGRRILKSLLSAFIEERGVDFTVVNGENSAGGAGITPRTLAEILGAGADVVTSGNHVYRQREVLSIFEGEENRLLRPANYSPLSPGSGFVVRRDRHGTRVAVVNVQGRVFMEPNDDPFAAVDDLLERRSSEADVILVDFHAEATSEKKAMGRFLDGRVAAVVGTHTHVPTADAVVLPGGTAYVTDLGMTGPHDSCLGVETEIILGKFRTGMPARFEVAKGDVRMQGLLVEVDPGTGLARSVERVDRALSA